jgi:DNA invertase Pin-like site-specific DNA recombinase
MMLEREREGIAKAQSEGKYGGRAPTARVQAPYIRRLASEGDPGSNRQRLKIGATSVYRVLKAD